MKFRRLQTSPGIKILPLSILDSCSGVSFHVLLNSGNEFSVIHQYLLNSLFICRGYKRCVAYQNESCSQGAYSLVVARDVCTSGKKITACWRLKEPTSLAGMLLARA